MKNFAHRLGRYRYEADQHYRSALRAYSQGDSKAAIEQIQMAIEVLPTHAEYHAACGYLLFVDKDSASATESFERALVLHPYEMLANYGLGMIAYREKRWQQAAACFTNALAARPKRAETQYYLAMILHRLGHNAEAIRYMQSAADALLKADDEREVHCQAWIKEFERLIESELAEDSRYQD